MSFLDNLFSAAQAQYTSAGVTSADISITTSPASPFPTEKEYPDPIGLGWGQLTYTPSQLVSLGHFHHLIPAFFEGQFSISVNQRQGSPSSETIRLQITAPSITFGGSANYSVSISFSAGQPSSFAAEMDPTTNVVYGAEGTRFIAISLGAPYTVINQ
jgi:hypothetical protein